MKTYELQKKKNIEKYLLQDISPILNSMRI